MTFTGLSYTENGVILMRSKRIESMEDYIFNHKSVTLDQLCAEFNVSKNTVRRDVEEIVSRGNFKKIYGGVCIRQSAKELISFDERKIKNLPLKQRIALKAAEVVEDGDIIFIDSGTTTCHLLESIKDRQNLTILTNSLDVINQAVPYGNIEVISLSGSLNRKTLSFTGLSAANVLQSYNISKAFMACTGLSIENGATNSSPLEYDIKRTVVRKSQLVCLLADSSKFGTTSLMTYCGLDEIDILVTDSTPPKEYADFFAGCKHQILLAK